MIPRILFSVLLTLWFFISALDSLMVETNPQPGKVSDGSTKRLQIRCDVGEEENVDTVQTITLSFNETRSNKKEIATFAGTTATILDAGFTGQDSTIRGAIVSKGSYLQLTIANVTCKHVGSYTCVVVYIPTGGNSQTTEGISTVEGRSDPGIIEIIREPPKDKYMVGETLTVRCEGNVGKPAGAWSWQRKEEGTWKPYTAGVTQDEPVEISRCAFSRKTSFQYRIVDEEKKEFRCIVGSDTDTATTTSINGHVISAGVIVKFSTFVSLFCFSLIIW